MKFEWELIDKQESENGNYVYSVTYRAKVIGGWLVQLCRYDYQGLTTTFVPDPTHEWVIEE